MAISYPLSTPTTGIAQINLIARNATASDAIAVHLRATGAAECWRTLGSRYRPAAYEARNSRAVGDVSDKTLWAIWHVPSRRSYRCHGARIGKQHTGHAARQWCLTDGRHFSDRWTAGICYRIPESRRLHPAGSGTSTQLYKVLDDVDSNASGEASLTIFGPICGLVRQTTRPSSWQTRKDCSGYRLAPQTGQSEPTVSIQWHSERSRHYDANGNDGSK